MYCANLKMKKLLSVFLVAIWNLNFENENQRIDSIEKFIEFHVEEDNNVFGLEG